MIQSPPSIGLSSPSGLPSVSDLATGLPSLSSAGMVDIDASALISGGIFVVMLLLLNQLLFKPYLAITHERARLTTGAKGSADATLAEAESLLSRYQGQLSEARAEASALREQLRRSGEADETRIVSSARDQAASKLAAKRDELARQVAAAERDTDARASELSQAIVSRVLS